MFRDKNRISAVGTVVLWVALSFPCTLLAQRGGHGAGAGGGEGGGLGGGTGGAGGGISVKDDLKGFHEVLAVQASREQITAYAAMLKSTAAASAEVQNFVEQLGKPDHASEVAKRSRTLADAVETARQLDKAFVEGFSEPQKSGLKEIIKKLTKADSELGQQSRMLDQGLEARSVGQSLESLAQGLERALGSFQHEQTVLGAEMSIDAPGSDQDFPFDLIPVKNSANIANRSVTITTSGVVSKGPIEAGQNTFAVELLEDMDDVQQNIAEVLRVQLDKTERCGDRIAIQTATLAARPPGGAVLVQLHFERWACNVEFSRESMDELTEANGTIEVMLMPSVAEGGVLRLAGQIGRTDAEGFLGDSLRSGTLGEALRDGVTQSVLAIIRQGGDFKAALPTGTRSYATLRRARFQDTGSGKLLMVLDGEIRVTNEKLSALTGELKRVSQPREPLAGRPELMSR